MPRNKPYKGILLKRLPAGPEGLLGLPERLDALYKHYLGPDTTVSSGDEFKVLLGLAFDHVPGFRSKSIKRTGPAPKVTNDIMIFMEMQMRIDNDQSVINAARHVHKKFPHLGKPETIRRRWYKLFESKGAQARVANFLAALETHKDRQTK